MGEGMNLKKACEEKLKSIESQIKNITKSGNSFNENSKIKIKQLHPPWVSRGAFKLLKAINHFDIDIENKICLDIGSSTGGFTEVLLKKNAKKIYSIDVGTNQL